MIRFTFILAITVLPACDGGNGAAQKKQPDAAKTSRPAATLRETILRNMPTNSEQRCVGISVVTEALLDEHPTATTGNDRESAEDVARRIYRGLGTARQSRHPPRLVVGKETIAIESPVAIEALSALVTEYYKQDFLRLSETEPGRQKLLAAEDAFVATEKALDQILDAEPDKTDAFFGSGSRTFPDGKVETTHHVFLIGKRADGAKYVLDSNDPGSPIVCKVANQRDGVEVEWTCNYRKTGKETTQRYLVVQKDEFFRLMRGE